MPSSEFTFSVDQPKILIVDDRDENLLALQATLEELDADVLQAGSGAEALGLLLENKFAVILLDVQMPEMDGYEVAEMMKQNSSTRNIPIIFLTALSRDEQYVHKGYQSGAVDYLTKPLDTTILLAKAQVFLKLWQQSNELSLLQQKYEQANKALTEQRDQLKELSIKDYLTGLYQRRVFDEMLEKEIYKSFRHKTRLSVAMLDLDHFKQVNDNYGHAVGDQVLVETTRQMMKMMRASDVLSRYGGEEFLILMPNTRLNHAVKTCDRLRQAIGKMSLKTGLGKLSVTISIGVATLKIEDKESQESLLKRADEYLYEAKNAGRNQVKPNLSEQE